MHEPFEPVTEPEVVKEENEEDDRPASSYVFEAYKLMYIFEGS